MVLCIGTHCHSDQLSHRRGWRQYPEGSKLEPVFRLPEAIIVARRHTLDLVLRNFADEALR